MVECRDSIIVVNVCGYKRSVEAVEMLVMGDIDGAMNEFNKKVVVKE